MNYNTNRFLVLFELDFVKILDEWKSEISKQRFDIKTRTKYLIERDLNELREK